MTEEKLGMRMKPTVFISYNHKSAMNLADELEAMISPIATIKRDKHLGSWADLNLFMESIKEQDFAVLFISDEFLKSDGCMFEVISLMQKPSWVDATMYVVMDNARAIYQAEGQIDYIRYWKEEADRLQEKLDSVFQGDGEAYKYQIKEVEKRTTIYNKMGEFLSLVARRKNPNVDAAFEDVTHRVETAVRLLSNYSINSTTILKDKTRGCSGRKKLEYCIYYPVAVLLDVSGSMCGEKIYTVKENLHEFLRVMREKTNQYSVGVDFALLTFSSDARTVIPFYPITDKMIDDDIDYIEAGGVTNLGLGIEMIYELIMTEYSKKATVIFSPQVILITDGIPTDNKPYNECWHLDEGILNIENGTSFKHDIVKQSMYIATKWSGIYLVDDGIEYGYKDVENFLLPVTKINMTPLSIFNLSAFFRFIAGQIMEKITKYECGIA